MDIKKIINNFVEAHTDEIEAAIRSALSEEKSINEIKAGDHFEYKGIEWVCLDVRNKTAFAVTAKVIANMPFNDKYEDGCNKREIHRLVGISGKVPALSACELEK